MPRESLDRPDRQIRHGKMSESTVPRNCPSLDPWPANGIRVQLMLAAKQTPMLRQLGDTRSAAHTVDLVSDSPRILSSLRDHTRLTTRQGTIAELIGPPCA